MLRGHSRPNRKEGSVESLMFGVPEEIDRRTLGLKS